MGMQTFGYIRVSSRDQNEDRQRIALSQYSISVRNLYVDKQSGSNFERPAYQRLLKRLRPGDLIIIKSIDRLGRNYQEIIEQWKLITRGRKADIVILDMPLLDTRRDKDLLGTFISDLVLQVLSFVAQTERESIRQRQAEGIAAAKARGVRFGRPSLPVHKDFPIWFEQWKAGHVTSRKAAAELKVSQATFLSWSRLSCLKK